MLKKGDKIGEYILLYEAGSGGFGDVWKAEKRTALDVNYFALKFFRPKDDRIDFDKIGKELGVWKQLKGLPHIISVIELDRIDDYVYVVSDFAEGGSLENWLKDNGGKASSEAESIKITLEILTGLENLHDKGFVHRDIKPDNILIMNGKFCLADFGVSREMKTHSKATGTAGTMEYMPPEAFDNKVSIHTDIWAVGIILQKLLTGELPFQQDNQAALIGAILMSEPEGMPENVPAGLREIIKKALQKDREQRFQTAREMREALKNPQGFLETIKAKTVPTSTIIDEDFDKTEVLKVEPIQDWQVIEVEKAYQPKESQTFKNSIGMEFVKIPNGSFMMGSPTSEIGSSNDERPQHQVTISKNFYLGKYEVTQGQWKAVMGNNPSHFSGCDDNCPVENVSWEDAQEFIKRLNGKGEGTYRLPTEAEWEYACRSGTTGAYSGSLDEMGWYDKNSGDKTHPVGQKKANAFGLYDMHGNVWEWTADWYESYSSGSVTDPTGASSGSDRVLRGGSYSWDDISLRSANRTFVSPSHRNDDWGFRVVRE